MIKEIIGNSTLYHADCNQVLPQLGEVDALVTDPPYGIFNGKNGVRRIGGIKKAGRNKITSATDYGEQNWDNDTCEQEIAYCRGLAKYHIIFGGNYYHLPPTQCWLVWDKCNGSSHFADCELAWTNLKKSTRMIKFLWNGCMRRERHEDRTHPTQKPVGVMKWCIDHLPSDANTILDPFMGSGATGVAAASVGKSFIGIEREEKYFNIACERITKAMKQPDMFGQQEQEPEYAQNALL